MAQAFHTFTVISLTQNFLKFNENSENFA